MVQKTVERRSAGADSTKTGLFFQHSRRWASNILQSDSPESFPPLIVKTEEEDKQIVQKGREQFCAVRAVNEFRASACVPVERR